MNGAVSEHSRALDLRLVEVAKGIKIVSVLSWKPVVAKRFLRLWHEEKPKLPKVKLSPLECSTEKKSLHEIMATCDRQNPLQQFIASTAESYILACELLENVGTQTFTDISRQIYGDPSDLLPGANITALDAAIHFIEATNDYRALGAIVPDEVCLLPHYVARRLRKDVRSFFKHHDVEVIVDKKLLAKAVAGPKRIRIRQFTCFSESDIAQLLHHEAYVHMLTALNGETQPNLKCLQLEAPRTAMTQEGLAVFAELITHSIDLQRLRRISLRVQAIDMALRGADFIQVFRYFLEAGQDEIESFQSAARIYRGGNVRGKSVFTKDVVYLKGFVSLHHFLQTAMKEGKISYPHYLVAGKLSTDDIPMLEPLFEEGILVLPLYQPQWIVQRSALLAFLLYSSFVMNTKLSE